MQSPPDQIGIRARQVPQSIGFLRKLEVPATRIAGIFGESADNIRHIDSRSYIEGPASASPSVLDKDDLALLKLSSKERHAQFRRNIQGIRLRSKQDLDQVEDGVWAIFRNHRSVGLDEGYTALLAMLPGVANARHGNALKVRLLMEEKLAWFALSQGKTLTALAHAERAMRLATEAFRESAGEKGYLLSYSESALVASICLQKLHLPERAFAFIKAADDANIAAGQLPGSEHLRQRGASFMHMGVMYDDLAHRAFTRAPRRMDRKNEAQHPVDLAMNGMRQRAFLNPAWGWDKSLELVAAVSAAYGERSMQFGVAAKSAALIGLKLATVEATETALGLLDAISPASTLASSHKVRNILSITTELNLSPDDLDRWLRFAMNETPLLPRK